MYYSILPNCFKAPERVTRQVEDFFVVFAAQPASIGPGEYVSVPIGVEVSEWAIMILNLNNVEKLESLMVLPTIYKRWDGEIFVKLFNMAPCGFSSSFNNVFKSSTVRIQAGEPIAYLLPV